MIVVVTVLLCIYWCVNVVVCGMLYVGCCIDGVVWNLLCCIRGVVSGLFY